MTGMRGSTLAAAWHGDPADLQSEALTGFLAAVRALDPDDLEAVPLQARSSSKARRPKKRTPGWIPMENLVNPRVRRTRGSPEGRRYAGNPDRPRAVRG